MTSSNLSGWYFRGSIGKYKIKASFGEPLFCAEWGGGGREGKELTFGIRTQETILQVCETKWKLTHIMRSKYSDQIDFFSPAL